MVIEFSAAATEALHVTESYAGRVVVLYRPTECVSIPAIYNVVKFACFYAFLLRLVDGV